jgi:hypothetical protein
MQASSGKKGNKQSSSSGKHVFNIQVTPKSQRKRRSLSNAYRRLYALAMPLICFLAGKGYHTFPRRYLEKLPEETEDLFAKYSEKAVKDHLTVLLRKVIKKEDTSDDSD